MRCNTKPNCRYEPSKFGLAASELLDEEGPVLSSLAFSTTDALAASIAGAVAPHPEGARFAPGVVGTLQALLQIQLAMRNLGIVAVGFREVRDDPSTAAREYETIRAEVEVGDDRLTALQLVQRRTSFVSMQLVKYRARVTMFTEAMKHRDGNTASGQLMLLGTFGDALERHTAEHSMRLQIARHVQSLKRQLEAFPSTRDYYFQVGGWLPRIAHAPSHCACSLALRMLPCIARLSR